MPKNSEKRDKITFFSFIFPIPLPYASQPSFTIVPCSSYFRCMPDPEEIGIIVALEIGVQLGIKGESERFVVFTKMN